MNNKSFGSSIVEMVLQPVSDFVDIVDIYCVLMMSLLYVRCLDNLCVFTYTTFV